MKNETYNELAEIYKNKTQWKDKIDFVGSCLNHDDIKVKGKAIWILALYCAKSHSVRLYA